jgi:hypothetical protein
MCVAFGTGGPKMDFKSTRGWAGEVVYRGEALHALAYGNNVGLDEDEQSVSRSAVRPTGWGQVDALLNVPQKRKAVAMFLHLPLADNGEFILVDTRTMPHFLDNITDPFMPPPSFALTRSATLGAKGLGMDEVRISEYAGVYTVIQARRPELVSAALSSELVPRNRRPEESVAHLTFYGRRWPAWGFLLFCLDPEEVKDTKKAPGVLVLYPSRYPQVLFFPGVDQHDPGKLPDMNEHVAVDHALAWSVRSMVGGTEIHYEDRMLPGSELAKILPQRVYGGYHRGSLQNGDWVVPVDALRRGELKTHRVQAPVSA